MKTKQTLLSSAVLVGCASLSLQAQAALPAAPVLNFDAGVTECFATSTYGACLASGVKTGSYFGMDTNGNGAVTANERTALAQNNGLELGTVQAASGSHSGAPDGTESEGIDAAWSFFGNTGLHFTTAATNASSSGSTATIDFSGWRVTWNGISAINMGSGAWAGNADGVANLTCAVDCSAGDTYTLDYSATVPLGDPSGFGGVMYQLYLTGTVGSFSEALVTTTFNWYTLSGITTTIDLVSRTTDPDGILDPTSLIISDEIGFGACTGVITKDNGTITFPDCPDGTYEFDYSFSDSFGIVSNASTVTVVTSANPRPNSINDAAIVRGTTPTEINVLENDIDIDIDINPASVIATNGAHGTTSVNTTSGIVTYTANANYTGVDTFTYTVGDDTSGEISDSAVVTVTVNAFNTPASTATFSVGGTATGAGSATGVINMENIGVADTHTLPEDRIVQSCIGGCFDFELSGLTPGATGSVVLPLSTPVPAKADPGNTITYRKLINGTWRTFDRSTGDSFRTAPGSVTAAGVSCPPPGSSEYTGLTTGHNCLLLNISDGGPNDADGLANGTVVDPGGLAEITRVTGTDGCSMTGVNRKANHHADWWLLSAFIGLLGWLSLKRKQV